MNEVVAVIVTANDCGHCIQFRGNGEISNGKKYTSFSFLNSLLLKGVTLLNINYLHNSQKIINDISKFYKKEKKIYQERYFEYEKNAKIRELESINDKKKLLKVDDILKNNKKISLIELKNDKIPEQIENFRYYSPCLMVFRKDDWNKALKNKNYHLYGEINACGVSYDKKIGWYIDRNKMGKVNYTYEKLIEKALSNNFKKDILDKDSIIKDSIIKDSISKDSIDNKIIIKYYD